MIVIQDDPAVLHMVRATLDHGGFESDAYRTAAEGLRALHESGYDALLLDPDLADGDGLSLLPLVQSSFGRPIIVLSARKDEASKVTALDRGADDYVSIPFRPGELLARIRALLRRFDAASLGTDPQMPTPVRDLELSKKQRSLFKLLESKQGAIASIDEIRAAVWGEGTGKSEANVRVLVQGLRRKCAPFEITIVSKWGIGYGLEWDRSRSSAAADGPC